jgi:glucose-1-phosphate adenylyltransferase
VTVAGGAARRSILSPNVRIGARASVDDSILMHGVDVGDGAVIHKAIIDKNVRVPAGCRIGLDHEHDRARGFTVSESGVVVIGKGDEIPL